MEAGSGTAAKQRALWGARPRDWEEVREAQVHPLYTAMQALWPSARGPVCSTSAVAPVSRATFAAERGARVTGYDAAALIEIARDRTPAGDFSVGEMEILP